MMGIVFEGDDIAMRTDWESENIENFRPGNDIDGYCSKHILWHMPQLQRCLRIEVSGFCGCEELLSSP